MRRSSKVLQEASLDETIDENWEPTFAEIQEYALWLGMDEEDDQEEDMSSSRSRFRRRRRCSRRKQTR